VIIPAGSNSINFNLNAVDDTLIELAKNYTIIATAQGFVSGSDTLAIIDNDAVTLTLDISLPSQATVYTHPYPERVSSPERRIQTSVAHKLK
ncbi:MAG: hypothetical protein ACKPA7_23480, partial [Sphaerospermopsis kisseleviana]